jgi:hypothetical protein
MEDQSWAREKRKWVRINTHRPCIVVRFDEEGNARDQGASSTLNLSSEEVGLETDFSVRPGEILKITMALGDQLVSFRGRVAYVKHSEGQSFQSGISIGDIGKMDRIALARFIYYFKPPESFSEEQ